MTYLPDDIWHMVCTHLWHQRDLNTLFKCICSGKQLAAIAVKYLYQYSTFSYVIKSRPLIECSMQDAVESSMKDAVESSIEDAIESGPLLEAGLRAVYRGLKRECNCALKWRTILLSSQGKTLYPYSQYIHVLNLQDLERLLTRSEIGDIANM